MWHFLGWANLIIVAVVLLGVFWVSPVAALLLLLFLVIMVALVERATPRGGVAARLRRGLRPRAARPRRRDGSR
jgi:hypothetical protein